MQAHVGVALLNHLPPVQQDQSAQSGVTSGTAGPHAGNSSGIYELLDLCPTFGLMELNVDHDYSRVLKLKLELE